VARKQNRVHLHSNCRHPPGAFAYGENNCRGREISDALGKVSANEENAGMVTAVRAGREEEEQGTAGGLESGEQHGLV
jgi:hypothetical protein